MHNQDASLDDLLSRLRRGKPLVLLAGAGISATAGIRTGEQLSRALRKEHAALFLDAPATSYEETFRRALPDDADRRARIEVECFGRGSQPEHLWLAQLMKQRRLRAVITTNFDHLIEHALMRLGVSDIPLVLHDDELRGDLVMHGAPPLLKIHGDFLFKRLANLTEELQEHMRENMRRALVNMTAEADLFVIGYSGSDETVVSLIGEIVRHREPHASRVWWSIYQAADAHPLPRSPFDQLLESARDCGNPVTLLGPWSADRCLQTLGSALGVAAPVPCPFGIQPDGTLTAPARFAAPLQSLPADPASRKAAALREPGLVELVKAGGVVHVVQDPGVGGSMLLAAVAEAAGARGLYFDTRFAQRPPHMDLLHHLDALAQALDVQNVPSELFSRGAVVVVDGIDAMQEGHFMALLWHLAQGQRELGQGALVVSSHGALPREGRWSWLPGDGGTYRLHAHGGASIITQAPDELEPLLEVLALPLTAIPVECTSSLAHGCGAALDWNLAARFVERRRGRVALRAREATRRRKRPGDGPRRSRLARELLAAAEDAHPLRRVGLALEAESLHFAAGDDKDALRVFLGCAPIGLRIPHARGYFCASVHDYVDRVLSDSPTWGHLGLTEAMDLFGLAVGSGVSDDVRIALLQVLSAGRTKLERALLVLHDHVAADEPHLRSLVARATALHCAARGKRGQLGHRARLAIWIGAAWLQLADRARGNGDDLTARARDRRGLNWSQRARKEARRAGDVFTAGLADDKAAFALLAAGGHSNLEKARRILGARFRALGRAQGWSAEKAANLSGHLHLSLHLGKLEAAEAHFMETVFHNAMLQRWVGEGVEGDLHLLGRFAESSPTLPPTALIQRAIQTLRATHFGSG